MAEKDDLQQELEEVSYQGTKRAMAEQEPMEFPREMSVTVTNWPQEKEKPEVEKVEVVNWRLFT